MKIAVVGAGFTGCAAALYTASQGHEVTVFDSGTEMGGVLRDIDVDRKIFYNGCQYLQNSTFKDEGFLSGLLDFPHEYGSLTCLGSQQTRVLNDCAQPALDGLALLMAANSIEESAIERLRSYGHHAEQLSQWASRFGNLSELDWRCLIPMQLSRVYFPDEPKLLLIKEQTKKANQLLAIPRRIRNPGQPAEPAWLPTSGFNKLFCKIHESLNDLGVLIKLCSPVRIISDSGRVQIYSRGITYSPDFIVWTSNPTSLLKKVCNIELHTAPILMKLMVGEFKRNDIQLPCQLPYYWQIFDSNSCIVRLYIYEIQGAVRYSAEAFGTADIPTAWKDLDTVLRQLGLTHPYTQSHISNQQRHMNFSSAEYLSVERATPELLRRGIIPGGWLEYGRENKLSVVKELIDQNLMNQIERR